MKVIMVKHLVILRLYFKVMVKYRANILAKLVYLPVRALLISFLWVTIYSNNTNLNIKYIISYYIIALIVTQMYPYIRSARYIEKDIIEGKIALYLTRPIGYLRLRTLKFISHIGVYFAMTSGVIIMVAIVNRILIYRIIMFLLMLAIGTSIQYLMWTIVGLISFWIEKNLGMLRLFNTVSTFCAGSLIPLSFLSNNVQKIMYVLPFKFTLYVPIELLLNDTYNIEKIRIAFLTAGIWVFVLVATVKYVWSTGCRRYNPNFN